MVKITNYGVRFPRWLALGAWSHLQELGKRGVRKMCCNAPSAGHPLKCVGT